MLFGDFFFFFWGKIFFLTPIKNKPLTPGARWLLHNLWTPTVKAKAIVIFVMRSLWPHIPHPPWHLSAEKAGSVMLWAPIKEIGKLPLPAEVTQEAPALSPWIMRWLRLLVCVLAPRTAYHSALLCCWSQLRSSVRGCFPSQY